MRSASQNPDSADPASHTPRGLAHWLHPGRSSGPEERGTTCICSGSSCRSVWPRNPYTGHLYEDSQLLADCVLDSYCEATEFANLGIQENDTMTGINWSRIPVVIIEMGFMTNEQDDINMADDSYRELMVNGITEGINAYFGF